MEFHNSSLETKCTFNNDFSKIIHTSTCNKNKCIGIWRLYTVNYDKIKENNECKKRFRKTN